MVTANIKRQPLWRRIAYGFLFVAGVVYLCILAFVYFRQEALIFNVTPLPSDHQFSKPDTQEVAVQVDGAKLSALHFRLPNPSGVVFFLHGNGGNLETWLTSVDFYRRTNFDLFMIDYRGYGKSSGRIESEAQLHADVRAAWDQIAPQYADKKKVIYGRSLGTGLATRLAMTVTPDLTVLVSPYESLLAMGKRRYSWIPGFVSRYPIRTDEWIGSVKSPVLMLHGDRDTIIPLEHAELLKQIRPDAELAVITGAGHNDIHKFPAYLDKLAARLQGI